MNHKEFFNVLIGNPPPEVELQIEIKKREVKELPNFVMKEYCLNLVKENKLQDVLIMAAIQRISETETKLLKYEMIHHHYTKNLKGEKKYKKKTLLDRIKAMLGMLR
tara:strand:+ start:208 stop:528 length:321 start_codon:yes stop_codon:yes gene_type:complete